MKCPSPVTLKNERGDNPPFFSFPCGKCLICKARKAREWTVRIEKELKYAKSAYFITLTYKENPLVLEKRDIQLFFKRLRKATRVAENRDRLLSGSVVPLLTKVSKIEEKGQNLRYYVVGEYGGKNGRPHWHLLLFNYKGKTDDIMKSWKNGLIHVGDVNTLSIKYVLSYLIDKDSKNVVLMSRRPGIGYGYLEMVDFHKSRKLFATIKPGGGFDLLPRYYKDKFFNKIERRLNYVKQLKIQDKKEMELMASDLENGDAPGQLYIDRIEISKNKLIKRYKKKKL